MLQQLKQVKSQLSDLIGAFDGSEKCHIWYGGGTATTTATTATTTTTTSMMMSGDRRSDELQKSLGSLKTSLQALQEPTIAKTDTAEKRVLLNRYLQQVRVRRLSTNEQQQQQHTPCLLLLNLVVQPTRMRNATNFKATRCRMH